jgi:hypothetical protein
MLDELNSRNAGVVAAVPRTRSDVERALPGWCAERQRLHQDRARRHDTTGGDRLVVGFVRSAGLAIASGLGILAGWLTYLQAGVVAGLAVGIGASALSFAVASAAVLLTRGRFARQERERQDVVAGLESAIRDLDGRISRAFLEHALVGHAPGRPSF